MRWSYKTVHFELKKEGLLGSSFLDESEVEYSLNEYGKAGWELVSMLETMDGLIAVFKQPLSLGSERSANYTSSFHEDTKQEDVTEEEQFILNPLSPEDDDTYDEEIVVEDFDVVDEAEVKSEKVTKNSLKDVDVGSIVIE
ncbi:DUF4177 domain-containing protein [Desulforhopalus sp. IMCC35007]|uniref:DUF4177 domain-containing protein n=1 Tax=Desulforhopalus sp. IMCC35007 TaxID=2569543 RepID=UPI0010AE3615|nr:DUF4177 domain-containing protein [Desulforhopalus sp. IMCC35007]TKB09036.1 DUF4177 domain-containing protein [Desulforhopalus sp. IMCC35007]